jgi:hypothetical protein
MMQKENQKLLVLIGAIIVFLILILVIALNIEPPAINKAIALSTPENIKALKQSTEFKRGMNNFVNTHYDPSAQAIIAYVNPSIIYADNETFVYLDVKWKSNGNTILDKWKGRWMKKNGQWIPEDNFKKDANIKTVQVLPQ